MSDDILTGDQRKLFNNISATTITLWKNNSYVREWYGDDVSKLHEYFLLSAVNSHRMWGSCFVAASVTVH